MDDMKNREAMLNYLSSTAVANCEADVESFLKIFSPAPTRTEMGEIFEKNLGFNPLTHYDIQDILNAFDEISNDTEISTDGARILMKKKDEIVDKAMEIFESRRGSYLAECLYDALGDYMSDSDREVIRRKICAIDPNFEPVDVIDDDDDDSDDDIGADMSDLEDDERPDLLPLSDDGTDGPEFTFDEDDDNDD